MIFKKTIVSFLIIFAFFVPEEALGQEQIPPIVEVQDEKVIELRQWVSAYKQWKEWFIRKGGKIARSNWTGRPLARKQRPEPPLWLGDECLNNIEWRILQTEGCELLREYNRGAAHLIARREIDYARQKDEIVTKTSFLEYLHFDTMWTTSSTNSMASRPIGPIGMHMAFPMPFHKRLQVTIPPGVMFFLVPAGSGRRIAFAVTGGFSYRFVDLRIKQQRISIHGNIAKAWFNSNGGLGAPMDVAGLSVTFKH